MENILLDESLLSVLFLSSGIYLILAEKGRLQINPDITKQKEWKEKYGAAAKWGGWALATSGGLRLVGLLLSIG